MIRLAIHGAAGRMGLRLFALASEDKSFELVAGIDRASHPSDGRDLAALAGVDSPSIALCDTLACPADVLIDFSIPAATRVATAQCVERRTNMVVGTTGLTDEDHRGLDEAAQRIAILQAPNMSLAVNLLFSLAAQVAKRLGDDYDVEIVEAHHRFKTDAPSGTALGIAEAICEATARDMSATLVHGRSGDAPRQRGQIGMHALRTGDVVGRHTVSFGTLGEELQLGHIATTRDIFARGALTAAKWIAGKPPGRYQLKDVLGL